MNSLLRSLRSAHTLERGERDVHRDLDTHHQQFGGIFTALFLRSREEVGNENHSLSLPFRSLTLAAPPDVLHDRLVPSFILSRPLQRRRRLVTPSLLLINHCRLLAFLASGRQQCSIQKTVELLGVG
jgi:hypothetical protein